MPHALDSRKGPNCLLTGCLVLHMISAGAAIFILAFMSQIFASEINKLPAGLRSIGHMIMALFWVIQIGIFIASAAALGGKRWGITMLYVMYAVGLVGALLQQDWDKAVMGAIAILIFHILVEDNREIYFTDEERERKLKEAAAADPNAAPPPVSMAAPMLEAERAKAKQQMGGPFAILFGPRKPKPSDASGPAISSVRFNPEAAQSLFNSARAKAMDRQVNEAFRLLDMAIMHGFGRPDDIQNDMYLNPLRQHNPALFDQLVEKARRVQQMR